MTNAPRYNRNSISTTYQNTKFRSFLETIWVKFLNHVKEPWEYEEDRFILDDLVYTPDFWLKNMKMWLEVKGGAYTREDIEKAERLAKRSKTSVILSTNKPFDHMLEVIHPDSDEIELCTWSLDDKDNLDIQPFILGMKGPLDVWPYLQEYNNHSPKLLNH